MTDIQYTSDNMFTHFFPLTAAGEDAWREMAKDDGVAAVFNGQAKAVISQLRAAGYSVVKAKKAAPLSADEIDELLAGLGA